MLNAVGQARRSHVFLLGKGTVGTQVLSQLANMQVSLVRDHDLDVRVAGVADTRALVFDAAGLDPSTARERLVASDVPAVMADALDRLASLTRPILLDCTAADGMHEVYAACFARGVHVVSANKKPFAIDTPSRDALFAAARRHGVALRYETTVGASLPIIETLRNLVRTGDRVDAIEGSLSGTLGFVVQSVAAGDSLSSALRTARARGYTEPHPRDDLTGLDVARKALILAREMGLTGSLADVKVEPLVPASLLEEDDVDAFLDRVAELDESFSKGVRALADEGRQLRYLARIIAGEGGAANVTVGPVGVDDAHPARALRGTESFVAFRTARYFEYPLVVKGPGAGGALTASGVLADAFAIASHLRDG